MVDRVDGPATLSVLHQDGWRVSVDGGPLALGIRWTRAVAKSGLLTNVLIGLHAMVESYQVDPYPDYRPSELDVTSSGKAAEHDEAT